MFDGLLDRLGIHFEPLAASLHADEAHPHERPVLESINPATEKSIGAVRLATADDYEAVVRKSEKAFHSWRMVPAPKRGEVVRQLGQALREQKRDLGLLVTLEMGKPLSEGEGEVQEMIDICDYAVGLSRQLYGLTIASERPRHRMMEQWHPLGPVGIVTAFNFPVAVWAWNAAIAAVCGDTTIWKPSPETPLCAIAVQNICDRVMKANGCDGVFNLCLGEVATVGERLIRDPRVPLISATGSCAMGKHVSQVVAGRFGRCLLELGGNNAVILTPSANLDLALRAVVFAAVGTTGQRCTTLRRLIVHRSIAAGFLEKLRRAFAGVVIGNPWEAGSLIGPLVNRNAVKRMLQALVQVRELGGEILHGGSQLARPGYFVEPTLVSARPEMPIVKEETFAPILYAMVYDDLDEAIAIQNGVHQGLSSAIFTRDFEEAEVFLSPLGSDCGIANVNIGTSGAEIGGAFGGEKETGGGREAGSDSWKAYMRRQTCTLNWGRELPLAQGVKFDVHLK